MEDRPKIQELKAERQNMPSASGYSRLLNCPGSWALEQKCEKDEGSPEATSGTRIHAWLAGETVEPELTMQEMDTALMCRSLEESAIGEWSRRSPMYSILREERLYLRKGLSVYFSGQPDVVCIEGSRALLLDYKTSYGKQQDSSENDQLRALAVLLRYEYPQLTEITAGIVQPGAGMKVQLTVFTKEHLDAATDELAGALQSYKQPDAPLVLGEHCKWCRAKAICPKQTGQFTKLSNMTIGTGLDRQEMLTNDVLFQLLKQKGNVVKFIGELESEAKRRLEAGQTIEGDGEQYALVESDGKRKVTDNAGLAEKLMLECGITSKELLEQCATIKVSELDTLMRVRTGKKVKEIKAWQEENLADCIQKTTSGKVLERVKIREKIS